MQVPCQRGDKAFPIESPPAAIYDFGYVVDSQKKRFFGGDASGGPRKITTTNLRGVLESSLPPTARGLGRLHKLEGLNRPTEKLMVGDATKMEQRFYFFCLPRTMIK
jgi:hypothetical protein